MTAEIDSEIARPLPQVSDLTRFFWEATREHRLEILRCGECGYFIHYPEPVCPRCLSTKLAPSPLSGRGAVYSYTVTLQPFHPFFAGRVPYIVAVVELPEQPGLRMLSQLVDCDESAVSIGMPVDVTFEEVSADITLPLFRPSRPGEGSPRSGRIEGASTHDR